MQVAFVSLEVPFPTTSGKRNVLAGILDYLNDRVGAANIHYIKLGKPSLEDRLVTSRCPGIHFVNISLPAKWKGFLSILGSSLLAGTKSIQEALIYSPECERKLHDYVITNGVDTVICDTVRVGQFFANWNTKRPCRRVLYYEDLFSERYDKILASKFSTDEGKLILGTFAGKLPSAAGRLVEAPWVRNFILRTERDLLRKREVEQAKAFDAAGLLNPDECKLLGERCGSSVDVTMLPIRLPEARPRPVRAYHGGGNFIFLGKLDYLPNVVSLRHFVETCGATITRTLPEARIDIIGSGDAVAVRPLVEKFPGTFRLVGYVEDLQAALASCAALVIPMTVGSGVKLKTLDALAAGIPVISTPIGAEGIAIAHGVNGLIAERLEAFPALMKSCLDPQTNRRLSAGARALFDANYSHAAIDRTYDQFFLGQVAGELQIDPSKKIHLKTHS